MCVSVVNVYELLSAGMTDLILELVEDSGDLAKGKVSHSQLPSARF